MSQTEVVFNGNCHCGKVSWKYRGLPEQLTDCNCSICSRLAPLWGQADAEDITIHGEEHTLTYLWASKSIAFHSCKHCGCTTHWKSNVPEQFNRASVNFRLCAVNEYQHLRIRKFDGVDTWTFLD